MVDTIRLVSGDSKPDITLTLTDQSTNLALDLTAVTTTVNIKFRLAGSTTLLATIPCIKTDAANGIVSFDFSGGSLAGVAAGMYEGEIEIDYDGATHTVYDVLKFRVRDDF
tara:strand:- start:525 stop:857 length:333 start_codon:yes stop_codon:yes gene_type:complete